MASFRPGIVVFDLDGTLVDSRRDLAGAANSLIRELEGTPLDEATVGAMIGDGMRALVERALAAGCGRDHASDEELERFRTIYGSRLLEHTRPYPGVHTLLTRLRRRYPLAVLTNKPLQPTEALLAGLDLGRYFRAVVADGSGPARKPDPEGLLTLAAATGTGVADCLYVGDSAVDLHTARAAGCRIALARYGYGYVSVRSTELVGDEILLDAPEELLRHLE